MMSVGQLLFKQAAIFTGQRGDLNLIGKYLFNPWFFGAIFFFGISTFTWVRILTAIKLSVAYPILSVAYITTAIGAMYFFSERLNPTNYAGILLIMVGVVLVSLK